MVSWNFLSKRRKIKLSDFVSGATTLEEAIAIFRKKNVQPPTDGSLKKLFSKKRPTRKKAEPVSYTGGIKPKASDPVVVKKAAPVETVVTVDVGDSDPKKAAALVKEAKKKVTSERKARSPKKRRAPRNKAAATDGEKPDATDSSD